MAATELQDVSAPETEAAAEAYRTRKRADDVFPVPEIAATITHPDFERALMGDTRKPAYLQPTTSSEIQVQNGWIVIDKELLMPYDIDGLSKHYIQIQTPVYPDIDWPVLYALFTTINAAIKAHPEKFEITKGGVYTMGVVRIYIPDLMKALGMKSDVSQDRIDRFAERIKAYHSLLGIIRKPHYGQIREIAYPLINTIEIDKDSNTLSFTSPYLVQLHKELEVPRYKTDEARNAVINRRKEQIELPNYASLINTKLYGQRSSRAIAIVQEIVLLIVHAGSEGTPHIRIGTLIDRIPELSDYLDDQTVTDRDKNKALSRAFKTAWQYLDKYTLLRQKYKNIEFPTKIPTMRDMYEVLEFPHDGLADKGRKKKQ